MKELPKLQNDWVKLAEKTKYEVDKAKSPKNMMPLLKSTRFGLKSKYFVFKGVFESLTVIVEKVEQAVITNKKLGLTLFKDKLFWINFDVVFCLV